MIPIIPFNTENLLRISQLLLGGKVGVLPCDTIYGFSGITTKETEAQIRHIKGRNETQPFLELVTLEQAQKYADIPTKLLSVWPAPLTAIVKRKQGGTVALRVPDDELMLQLLVLTGPLFSTSVNLSGKVPLLRFTEIVENYKTTESISFFAKKLDLQGTQASTLIDTTKEPWQLIRQGTYDASSLLKE